MRTARRFVNEESGMTLALAMIMIVLIGVMGAGLLTFVSTDLNTVTEQNRGQRAFDVADAGIETAKHQLQTNVDRTQYNGDGAGNCSDLDIRWSALRCADPKGLTLTDLDGVGTTPDKATVTIRYIGCAGCATDYFRVISKGTYGDPPRQSMRRIEAVFNGVQAGAGGGGQTIGHPVYYTPSNIKIMSTGANNVKLNKTSLFAIRPTGASSGGDILMQSLLITQNGQCNGVQTLTGSTARAQFTQDMTDSGQACSQVVNPTGGDDELCDWNSLTPLQGCFTSGTQGNWNKFPRATQAPGLGATGQICSFTDISTNACPLSSSIADGVNGIDGTTTPRFVARQCQLDNTACDTNQQTGTISPPFPLPKPVPAALAAAACHPEEVSLPKCTDLNPSTVSYYDYLQGTPSDATWGLGTANSSSENKVAFIDARNQTVHWQNKAKGIIVVWCGRLMMDADFEGIILNLVGTLPGHTSCTKDTATVTSTGSPENPPHTVGTYENTGNGCQCWVYAEGGSSNTAGIQIDAGSTLQFRPSSDWSFQNSLFLNPPPTDFRLQNWRELYQASP